MSRILSLQVRRACHKFVGICYSNRALPDAFLDNSLSNATIRAACLIAGTFKYFVPFQLCQGRINMLWFKLAQAAVPPSRSDTCLTGSQLAIYRISISKSNKFLCNEKRWSSKIKERERQREICFEGKYLNRDLPIRLIVSSSSSVLSVISHCFT